MSEPLLRTDNEIAEIYNRQVKTVYRVCYTYLRNRNDCDDAVADTFVKFIKFAPSFENAEHEKAWLIRTAVNVCKDFLKHWWQKRENLEDLSDTVMTENNIPDSGTLDAICSLPENLKIVVLLYYYDGYSTVEISKILLKPESTIRYRLFKARKKLKESLGDEFQ